MRGYRRSACLSIDAVADFRRFDLCCPIIRRPPPVIGLWFRYPIQVGAVSADGSLRLV